MRSQRLPQAESTCRAVSLARGSYGACGLAASVAFCAASFFVSGTILAAQTNPAQTGPAQASPAPAPAASPAHKPVHPHKKTTAAAAPAPQPPPPLQPVPIAPPPPDWPANDQPVAASVVFDSRGLLVEASNSSLAQILRDVSTDTGIKVEGLSADQRIFGTYGPGPARDVLTQLLDGSGYNVLLIGDRGVGTPRRIVLSLKSGGGTQSAANNTPAPPSNEDTEADQPAPEPEAEQPQPQAQPAQNGSAPPVPVRTPQQIMQEIQERQRQQRTQNDQQNPPN